MGANITGNIYGGGNLADVTGNTQVNICAVKSGDDYTVVAEGVKKVTIDGNVFGGGKGIEDNFTCDKAMVGVVDESIGSTTVVIGNGTVTGNVYGGGEVGRVEHNSEVKIGLGDGTGTPASAPVIQGNVFGAGAGKETHGYSALVRGDATVTIEGGAKIGKSVYGGGEIAAVGKYSLNEAGLPSGLLGGGECKVTVQGAAEVTGDVFGAGMGVDESKKTYTYADDAHRPKRMNKNNEWEYYDTRPKYLAFLQTLALATDTKLKINGSAKVKGSVYGGSESGFVQRDTEVKIQNGTIGTATTGGNVFGGGKGLTGFDEAGRVSGNTVLEISDGTITKNVYGGGELGLVGVYEKGSDEKGTIYNWQTIKDKDNEDQTTGKCTVTITGGKVGTETGVTADHASGHVFGAGKGKDNTFMCEQAMVRETSVSISDGTVYGNVYGGGEVGRVDQNTKVELGEGAGTENGNAAPDIKGDVFGAGAGIETHGYSALVRGDAEVIVQGNANVGESVYGGGEIAAVGRYTLDDAGMPSGLVSGGECKVTVKGHAVIAKDVFGAGEGVDESKKTYTYADDANRPKRMNNSNDWEYFATRPKYLAFLQTLALATDTKLSIEGNAKVNGSVYGGSESGFVQRDTEVKIQNGTIGTATTGGNVFGGGKGLSTFAEAGRVSGNVLLATNGGTIWGNVFGGGELGIVKGGVVVNVLDGELKKDVYGGGALANTNTGNWDGTTLSATTYSEVTGLTAGTSSVVGYYTKSDDKYTPATGTAASGTKYYASSSTTVNLLGGTINGDAYGGGLGQKTGFNGAKSDIAALVYGDVNVNLGSEGGSSATAFNITHFTGDHADVIKSGRVFGCNNLNGSPQGDVTVKAWKTVTGKLDGNTNTRTAEGKKKLKEGDDGYVAHTYEVAAIYGGGNLANYAPTATGAKASVIIETCDVSAERVYGGGNAAEVPRTDVLVNGAYEIAEVFGGGNGNDPYTTDGGTTWVDNPGANVNGNANTLLQGGLIHAAYGGSNKKGTITGNVTIDIGPEGACDLDLEKMVGAGKDADVNGDLIMVLGCKPNTKIPLVYGGADNAHVNGDVELTITSGKFGQVFGGNNKGGFILGHIKLNIEETGNCAVPIEIDELYLGGNEAEYSMYGYYQDGTDVNGKPIYKSRTAEMAAITDPNATGYTPAVTSISGMDVRKTAPYAQPVLNLISCTRIGRVFGGGYGEGATLYGDPIVNINMIPGAHAKDIKRNGSANEHDLGEIGGKYTNAKGEVVDGGVFGGGDGAAVYGNTTINIGTASTVTMTSVDDNDETTEVDEKHPNVEGAYIVGNIYGGGNLANVGDYHLETVDGNTVDKIDVVGNTFVNIGAVKGNPVLGTDNKPTGEYNYTPVAITGDGYEGVKILGHVFGGGKGEAIASGEGAFRCGKAMVTGGTNVCIGNGTVTGFVYGGGEVGRVEENTRVTIGLGNGDANKTSAPVIGGDVFGAGKGEKTHGYSALVRGNTYVTIQGDAKLRKSVYGGGEIASVGRYNIANAAYNSEHPEVEVGMPYSLANENSGNCYVTVRGNAEIGPDVAMKMYHSEITDGTDKPDDTGHVFGAGKGILPYEGYNADETPWRMQPTNEPEQYGTGKEGAYLAYIETLALATQAEVTIGENAFVKGSVYGGSMNGHVQHDTHVTIAGGQIGAGDGMNRRYTTEEWASESLAECAHWDYVASSGAPYDPYAKYKKTVDGKDRYYYDEACTEANYAEGGSYIGKDGHTYYGNVFGGGSGVIPYAPGKWHRAAGSVGGNTVVDITGGHILTSVYGGNEQTDVGTYMKDSKGALVIPVSGGKCTVNMTGGTLGVPRTENQMKDHPVSCYLFGAGKGDQRIFFNTWTNVINTEVNITGDARIYGSTFGGGEDGHVINNAVTNIGGNVTIGETPHTHTNVIIGTTGTSYVDGNIFGGGRGFSGEAQTAGTVGGNVDVNISNGKMLGSVYGGGRLASVGTQFTAPDDPNYGNFIEDGTGENAKTYGHITVNISGGTIGNGTGNNVIGDVSGNVFGGSMGRLTLLNGTTNPIWPKMAQVKSTTVKVSGNALIKRNVFGGGELGTVRDNAIVNITSGQVNRDVYGGGYGSQDFTTKTTIEVKEPKANVTNPTSDADYDINYYTFTPMQWAGCVGKSTTVNISGGLVRKSVYGGGEMASVGIIDSSSDADGNLKNYVRHDDENNGFALSWPYEFKYTPGYEGATHVNVTGGRIGVTKDDDDINTDNGDVYGGGKGIAGDYKDYIYCANVGSSEVTINYASSATTEDPTKYLEGGDCIAGAVYGGAENGHVMGDTKLTLVKGLVGHSIYGGGSGKGQFTKTLDKIAGVNVVTNNAASPAATPPTQTTNQYDATIYSITAGKVFGNTEIEMTGGYVVRNVYGGGNLGSVGKGNYAGGADDYSTAGYGEKLSGNLWDGVSKESQAFLNSGKCTVKITGGNVGYIDFAKVSDYTYSGLPYGNVFGGCRGESAPNIGESPRYLYCPTFFSGYANETDVTIGTAGSSTGPKIWGSVYGGGMDGHVRRDAIVTINSGEIGRALTGDVSAADLAKVEWSQCGNVYGAGSGIGQYKYDFNYDGDYEDVVEYTNPQTGRTSTTNEKDFSTSAGSVTRFTKVDIKGGTIHRNVYGGGSLSSIGGPKIPPITIDPYRKGDTADGHGAGKQSFNEVIITGGTIGDATSFANGYGGYVFGASRGDETITNPSSFANSVWTDVKVQGGTIAGDVYGGGEVGSVRQGTEVALTGGIVNHDVFGGGKGTSTVAADIGGDVLVDVNGGVDPTTKGAVVKGNVFGANNVNGTPKGHVKVHVHGTQNKNTEAINVKMDDQFDVTGVYGGGKQADYVPADTETKQSTEVIIEGCDLTSIQEVYGGGYGAAVPGTDVLIKGTKIIDNVFGGGYGKSTDDFPDNPGANVGYLSDGTTVYGGQYGGKAIVELMAGHVNNVYGGSNTKGDIRGGSSMTTVDNDGDAGTCKNLDVGELYGGGKEAPMEGGAEIVLGCMPDDWIGEIYAGARQANVGNDVSLTITSGKFGRVYGGNRDSGQIDGYVEVNIEECPTCNVPVVIGELYGGGNNAAYTLPDAYLKDYPDYSSPRVNVRSFTSIGTIYGGGYGPSATVKGNPTVNINVGMVEGGGKAYNGEDKELSDNTMVKLWPHEMNKIGVIGNVFGGGNAAKVEGNTYVNIGTAEYEKLDHIIPGETSVGNYYIRTGYSPNYVYTKVPPKYAEEGKTYYERHDAVYTEITGVTVGTTDVSTYYTRSGEGTTESPYVFTPVCVAEADTVYCQPVLGADIRGDVYGGGNKAEVTGETNVKIGKE